MGAGVVMILLAAAAFLGRRIVGRLQANVLLEAFNIGADRQPEVAAGLATVWAGVSVMFFAGGLVIVVAALISR